MRILLAVGLAAALLATAGPASGRPPPGPKKATRKALNKAQKKAEQELGKVFARRIERATGVKVRIRELVYEVLTSTFIGRGVEAGPKKRPHLVIPRLLLQLKLFAKHTTVKRLEVDRPRINARARWVDQLYSYTIHQRATVRSARIKQGRATIHLKQGTIGLRGVYLTVKNLHIPPVKAGTAPALTGTLKLAAKQVRLGKLHLAGLQLEAKLAKKELKVHRLRLALPGGEVTLTGTVGFGGKDGPGPFALEGPIKVALAEKGPVVTGTLRMKGSSIHELKLDGTLTSAAMLPRSGGLKGAPALDLKLRAGKRHLRGTLRRWRLR